MEFKLMDSFIACVPEGSKLTSGDLHLIVLTVQREPVVLIKSGVEVTMEELSELMGSAIKMAKYSPRELIEDHQHNHFTCTVCSYGTDLQKKLHMHMEQYHPNRGGELIEHHQRNARIPCPICSSTDFEAGNLLDHMQHTHPNKPSE